MLKDSREITLPVSGHLRAGWRLARLGLHIVLGSMVMAVLIPVSRVRGKPTPPTVWWYRGAVALFGIRVLSTDGPQPVVPSLLVSNHISWMDIIVLASQVQSVFVSKAGVRSWFLIGWYARQFGTIFLERGKHQTESVGQAMAAGLETGVAVVVFPEATTSDYTRPRRFFARLFSGAIAAKVPIVPAALAYPDAGGQRMNPLALYVNDEPFLINAWRILAQRRTLVRVSFGDPISSTQSTRDQLAATSHAAVCGLLDDMIEDHRCEQ